MRKALVKMHDVLAGVLIEDQQEYIFQYNPDYQGAPISLTMPVRSLPYKFDVFPPFFDGLLPEGIQLSGLLKRHKIDKYDYFQQLELLGEDLVGAVTVFPLEHE